MTRRCSHCNHNGHNSRTCPSRGGGGGLRLFGVRIAEGSSLIRKSASMSCLSHLAAGSSGGSASPADGTDLPEGGGGADGYASDDGVRGRSRERKKGTPWTEDEHRMFLLGLQKLGKGDWRGISRNFVVTRTPTQVASHAQKYFIRQTNVTRRKRRSSLFDIIPDESVEPPSMTFCEHQEDRLEDDHVQPSLLPEEVCESMDSSPSVNAELSIPKPHSADQNMSYMLPAFYQPFMIPLPAWPLVEPNGLDQGTHEVVKPTAVHSNVLINIDEIVGISKLSIGESDGGFPSSLSLNSLGDSNRRSAFHASSSTKAEA